MFELHYIELSKLLRLRPAMDYETGGLEFHVRAIQLFGSPVIWINSDTKRILTNPQEVKALASMKKAKQPRPRFVRGDGDAWLIPTIWGRWDDHDEQKQALRLNGGVGGTMQPRPYADSLLPVLLSYDESNWTDALAVGLDTDALLYMLDQLAGDVPPPQPEPPVNVSWDIPTLNPALQGVSIQTPVKYGTVSRNTKIPGATYHFYTADSKFAGLIRQPEKLLESECESVIEPNFSTAPGQARALVLADIYQKRRLARFWQEHGIRVFVDLNIHDGFFDLALLGVPSGWAAYANRAYARDLNHLTLAYDLARSHAGQEITYFVYGGGTKARQLCEANGWQWLPDHTHEVHGDGQG